MAIQPEVFAQLAAAAYRDASDENRIVAPAGWTEIATYPGSGPSDDPVTGLSAVAYRGPDGDIVIAYAGTNVDSVLDNDWLKANAPAALGLYSQQVTQAAEFYWQVLSRPDVGIANKGWITFTEQSLGGGLASLMATYFDRPATTFDSAPFELSAFVGSALGPRLLLLRPLRVELRRLRLLGGRRRRRRLVRRAADGQHPPEGEAQQRRGLC